MDFPKPFGYADLDALAEEIDQTFEPDTDPGDVARSMVRRIKTAMADSYTVFYQP